MSVTEVPKLTRTIGEKLFGLFHLQELATTRPDGSVKHASPPASVSKMVAMKLAKVLGSGISCPVSRVDPLSPACPMSLVPCPLAVDPLCAVPSAPVRPLHVPCPLHACISLASI